MRLIRWFLNKFKKKESKETYKKRIELSLLAFKFQEEINLN